MKTRFHLSHHTIFNHVTGLIHLGEYSHKKNYSYACQLAHYRRVRNVSLQVGWEVFGSTRHMTRSHGVAVCESP